MVRARRVWRLLSLASAVIAVSACNELAGIRDGIVSGGAGGSISAGGAGGAGSMGAGGTAGSGATISTGTGATSSTSGSGATGATSTGGTGSSGTGATSTGGTGSGGSGGGVFEGPVVGCGEPFELCPPNDACCLHALMSSFDHCAPPVQCPIGDWGVLECDGPEDCPGEVCCGKPDGFPPAYVPETICLDSCNGSTVVMCNPDVPLCPLGDSCQPAFDGYPGYWACL